MLGVSHLSRVFVNETLPHQEQELVRCREDDFLYFALQKAHGHRHPLLPTPPERVSLYITVVRSKQKKFLSSKVRERERPVATAPTCLAHFHIKRKRDQKRGSHTFHPIPFPSRNFCMISAFKSFAQCSFIHQCPPPPLHPELKLMPPLLLCRKGEYKTKQKYHPKVSFVANARSSCKDSMEPLLRAHSSRACSSRRISVAK